jgi:hypothetical protein
MIQRFLAPATLFSKKKPITGSLQHSAKSRRWAPLPKCTRFGTQSKFDVANFLPGQINGK